MRGEAYKLYLKFNEDNEKIPPHSAIPTDKVLAYLHKQEFEVKDITPCEATTKLDVTEYHLVCIATFEAPDILYISHHQVSPAYALPKIDEQTQKAMLLLQAEQSADKKNKHSTQQNEESCIKKFFECMLFGKTSASEKISREKASAHSTEKVPPVPIKCIPSTIYSIQKHTKPFAGIRQGQSVFDIYHQTINDWAEVALKTAQHAQAMYLPTRRAV